MEPYIISFLGNKEIWKNETVLKNLLIELERVLNLECFKDQTRYPVFYCGGYGDFGQIASEAIDTLRERHPELKSEKVFVTPYIAPSYLKVNQYMKEFYDEIVYPPLENVPPKFAISRRNQWMIDRCDLLIACMEHTLGNTRKCVDYAMRKNKFIVFVGSGKTQTSWSFEAYKNCF